MNLNLKMKEFRSYNALCDFMEQNGITGANVLQTLNIPGLNLWVLYYWAMEVTTNGSLRNDNQRNKGGRHGL